MKILKSYRQNDQLKKPACHRNANVTPGEMSEGEDLQEVDLKKLYDGVVRAGKAVGGVVKKGS